MTATALAGAGCDSFGHLGNGFFNPAEMGRFKREPLLLPIVSTLDTGIEEPNDQFAKAEDVKPEDLVSTNQDYLIGRNDVLSISITDLVAPGVETLKQLKVSESGNISLPLVGQVRAEGLTEAQLETEIQRAYREANLMPQAQVSVSVIVAMARTFSIIGSVQKPGQYQITQADFRMLDALVAAGDISAQGVDFIYVVRHPPALRPSGLPAVQPGATEPAPAGPGQPNDVLTPHSDASGASDSVMPSSIFSPTNVMLLSQGSTSGAGQAQSEAQTASSASNLSANQPLSVPSASGSEPNPVIVAQATGPGANAPIPQPAGGATTPPSPSNTTPPPAPPSPPPPPAAPANGNEGSNQGFQFNGTDTGTSNRIIRVPVTELKNGDLRYNIVIRPGDMVIVPMPVTGEYYIDGHVNRTGVYSLTARNITLKQAIAAAGGLDQLAIPSTHTEIIRRIGQDKEVFASVDLDKVFSGQQPDIYLKPNDIVRVGTNAFAPFVAAFRNGYRITYGFGFLYDRNWAPQQKFQ
jgi:polysaccharide export outer membrane protein